MGIYIVLGTIPAVLFGALIHVLFPDGIRSIEVIAATTIIFGILMGIADRVGPRTLTISNMTLKKALLIGCAQALALIPGTSRSGITMTAARFLGFERVDAAKFSFLLGIPAMAAAGLLSFLDIFDSGNAGLLTDAAYAIFFAFLAGLAAIHFMMKWLPRFGLLPFVVYRLLLGVFLLFWFVI
jgi:undecaprenyl-diphosphatase